MINGVKGLSVLTLHDSHANLSDVLITWLFTLEGKRQLNRFHDSVYNSYVTSLICLLGPFFGGGENAALLIKPV